MKAVDKHESSSRFMTKTLYETRGLATLFAQIVKQIHDDSTCIKIGLIGEPGVGKSTFSEALVAVFPPSQDQVEQDEYGQFQYSTTNNTHIERVDLLALRTIRHDYTKFSRETAGNTIYIVEHPDQDPNLECDINIRLSFLKDGIPIDVADLEDELWQQNLNQEKQNDIAQICDQILNSTERQIDITITPSKEKETQSLPATVFVLSKAQSALQHAL